MSQIIELLKGPSISSSIDQQTALLDLIGLTHVDQVSFIAEHQYEIIEEFKQRSEEIAAKDLIRSIEERKQVEMELPHLGKQVIVNSAQTMEREKVERKKLKKARLKGKSIKIME